MQSPQATKSQVDYYRLSNLQLHLDGLWLCIFTVFSSPLVLNQQVSSTLPPTFMDKGHVASIYVQLRELGNFKEGVVEESQVTIGWGGDCEDDVIAARVRVFGMQVLTGDQGDGIRPDTQTLQPQLHCYNHRHLARVSQTKRKPN